MSYRFSNIKGRIINAAKGMGYGLKPSKPDKGIIYGPGFKPVKVASSDFGTASSGRLNPKLLKKYQHYQKKSDVPIHLRGGPFDYVLYYTTLGLTVLGVEECFRYYYLSAFKKKE